MKKAIALLLALMMAVSLLACGQTQEPETEPTEAPTTAPTEPPKKVIHVLIPAATEGWQAKAAETASETAETVKAAGVHEVVVATYADSAEQTKLLEEIAATSKKDGRTGVVTMPAAADMDGVFAKLLEANVAYALADVVPEAAEAASVTNVRCDELQIGAAAAAWLVQNGLTQDSKVIIIQGLSDEEALRTEGFQRYLQGKLAYNGAVIEDPWTTMENIVYSEMQGETAESAETYFTTYMEDSDHAATKFIAAWDDAYVLGVLEALEGENIDSGIKEKFLGGTPFIAGYGGSQAMLDVLTGTSQYTNTASFGGIQTVLRAQDMLAIAVQAMADYFDGQVVAQDNTQPVVWLSAENAAQYQGY